MNCTSCKKPIAVGAAKCPACGAKVAQEYSYDLLPDEPEKKTDEGGPGQQYQLPEGAILPPAVNLPTAKDDKEGKPARVLRADRPRGANAVGGGGKASLYKMAVGLAVVAIMVLLGTRMCGGPSVKISGNFKLEQSFSTSNNMTVARPFEIFGGKAEYTMTVEANNGDIKIGVVQRGARDKITPELVKGWALTPVAKGESKTLTGALESGQYSWIIATDSKVIVQGAIKTSVK
jgi:hypothetical protein